MSLSNFTKIKEHPVHDLDTTAVFLPSWLCSVCLGNSYFFSFVLFQVKLELLKRYKILCCGKLQEYSEKHSYVIAMCLYSLLDIDN